MIQVYTGNGKGKTTAALGLAIRAAGAGLKVFIAQFAKGKQCSEFKALKKLPNIKVSQFGSCRFIRKPTARDIALAEKGLQTTRKIIEQRKFDMVILDEINVVISLKLLKAQDVIRVIKKAPKKTEIILTGRYANPEIITCADLVSDIQEVKHYFRNGLLARRGIEF